jgi:hypothetical protein
MRAFFADLRKQSRAVCDTLAIRDFVGAKLSVGYLPDTRHGAIRPEWPTIAAPPKLTSLRPSPAGPIKFGAGIVAGSAALMADASDMLGDAIV